MISRRAFIGSVAAVAMLDARMNAGQAPSDSAVSAGRIERNVIYGMFSGAALLMDIHYPARSNGFGIIHVFGSGWFAPLDYSTVPLKERLEQSVPSLLDAGYTVFSVSHRSSPAFPYPAPIDDARRAVQFVRHNAAMFGITPTAIGGIGFSSGAHLVSLLGTLDGNGDPDDMDPINRASSKLQCIVARAAPMDLLKMSPTAVGDAIGMFLGVRAISQSQQKGSAGYKIAWDASPINHVTTSAAPFLLLHGDADQSVPFAQSVMMEAALRAADVPVKLIRIPGGGHDVQFPVALNAETVNWFDSYLRRGH